MSVSRNGPPANPDNGGPRFRKLRRTAIVLAAVGFGVLAIVYGEMVATLLLVIFAALAGLLMLFG